MIYSPKDFGRLQDCRLTSETEEDKKFLEWLYKTCKTYGNMDDYHNVVLLDCCDIGKDGDKRYLDLMINPLTFNITGPIKIPVIFTGYGYNSSFPPKSTLILSPKEKK